MDNKISDPFEICGLADCGCVYHAEDGVPCVHDIENAIKLGLIKTPTEDCAN